MTIDHRIRDRVEPTARPPISALPPKAKVDGVYNPRQCIRRRSGEVHDEALRTQVAPELLAE